MLQLRALSTLGGWDWQLFPSQAPRCGSDREGGTGLPSQRGEGAGRPSQADPVATLMAANL